MKKSLVLTALAATLAAPAFAQSSVTIYGRLNVSLENQKANDVTTNSVVDNASRIGFKGAEDLGGGLKAEFLIEHGFDATTGKAAGSAFWGRESWVGLSSKYGMLKLGNMAASDAYFATADYISMHNHDTGTSSDALWAYIVTGALKNAVSYTTPTFANTSVSVQFAEGDNNDNPTSVAANYDNGPIHIGYGYEGQGDVTAHTIRGLYEFGKFTFGAYYGQKDGGTGFDRKFARGSVAYAIGAGELHFNYGKTGGTKGIASSEADQWTVGYNHNLSKRTKVYTFYTQVNDGAAGLFGGDFTSFAVGVRHNF